MFPHYVVRRLRVAKSMSTLNHRCSIEEERTCLCLRILYVIKVCGSCIPTIVQVICHDSYLLALDLLVLL